MQECYGQLVRIKKLYFYEIGYFMDKNEIFLSDMISRINRRIDTLDNTLTEGVKDVEKMHDYYWENYTEMDEYGYENFDNLKTHSPLPENGSESLLRTCRFSL